MKSAGKWVALSMSWAITMAGLAGCMTGSEGTSNPQDAPLLSDNGWVPTIPVLPHGWPQPLSSPPDNPYTSEKAILGRRLFRETALSRNNVVSCLWCHDPLVGFTFKHGGLGSGVFQRPTRRGPPTLYNVAFDSSFMSDGSVASLEEQALMPLFAENEMDMTAAEVESRLSADTSYVRMFRRVFGPGPIRVALVAKALAAYQRTLFTWQSDFDRWRAGDPTALSPEAQAGEALFFGKADCSRCHVPPLFTDRKFHAIGLDSVPLDVGRMGVTGLAEDAGRFRTPTLRNIMTTPPYMHDGRFTTLEEVLEHYSEDVRGKAEVVPLKLTARERFELVEFLKTLGDPTLGQDNGF
jgi:cytochrome c peroxidase